MAESEPLRGRGLAELRELLRRQERLLGDRKFISKLPDKGKKILDFSEKLKIAILQEEELRRTTEHLSAVRLEFQKKQEEIESSKQKTVVSSNKLAQDDSSVSEYQVPVENKEFSSALQNDLSVSVKKTNTKDKTEPLGKTEIAAQSTASGSSEAYLVDAFERVSIGGRARTKKSEKGQNVNDSLLQKLPNRTPKTPHYIEVLEVRAKNPVTQKNKFKTNVLPAELSGSSHSSPGTSSPGSPSFSISVEERRQRDKKHLDDITAARLPPLHHAPTQLLSIAESLAIQIQQKEAYEEMQGRLAAQKLAEKLDIKMTCFEPEGRTVTNYREGQDEEGWSSAED